MKILFLCISGTQIGNGHLNRCITLSNFFKKKKIKSEIINLKFNNKILNDLNNLKKIIKEKKIKIIFLDFSSNSIIKLIHNFKEKIKIILNQLNIKIILIDSIKKESLYFPNLNITRVIPYHINSDYKFSGFKYVIIDEKFKNINKNIINRSQLKILVTFGGYDVKKTIKTIKALSLIDTNIRIKIIIGLLCNNKEIDLIKGYSIKYFKTNNYTILTKVNNISKHIGWSNLVISCDGITKYEIISAGRYGVILRNSLTNYYYGKSFEELKICKFVNYKTYSSVKKYAYFLKKVFKNKKELQSQSDINFKVRKKIDLNNYMYFIK